MITDYIIVAAILYLFYKGWSKGLLRTLLGPLSLVICCVAGFAYYQKTQNLSISLLISIIGPFILTMLTSLGLKFWRKAVSDKTAPSLSSSLMGSMFSILWGGSYIVLILFTIKMIPPQVFSFRSVWYEKVQNDVTSSKSYAILDGLIKDRMPAASLDLKKIALMMQDPSFIEQFESTEEFQNLVEDKRLKAIFSDEETAELIRSKNYIKILSNPKIQAVFQDQELLEKMFALNKRIMEGGPDSKIFEENTERQPELIESGKPDS